MRRKGCVKEYEGKEDSKGMSGEGAGKEMQRRGEWDEKGMGIWEEEKGIRRKDQERERELGSAVAERR